METSPDLLASNTACSSEQKLDYFVAIRADSGYDDIGGIKGDGYGLNLGADFKVFIEPRSGDFGAFRGGLLCTGQVPARVDERQSYPNWQDNPLTDYTHPGEPWWPENAGGGR